MDSIKLVIWDLDCTFWDGTLSEEGITLRPENHALVRELWQRGIMSSICSKNDLDRVRHALTDAGMWDQFVFAKVAWRPKGEMIHQIIEEMNLRPANVLFIDDNPQNLEEAKFFSPGLQTATPEVLGELLTWPACKGKSDPQLSRLKQYRQLEQKVIDQQQFSAGSNEDFLRQCQIRVRIEHDCSAQFDRLLEMIQRTNQLNFTKQRLDGDALRQILADPNTDCGYLRVSDRYGDYGIAGFYALGQGRLAHYLFSCRILNMGVESWLYDRLGRPQLDVVGETAGDPKKLPVPDWIAVESANGREPVKAAAQPAASGRWPRTIFKGGCDLQQIIDFLGRADRIDGEFNYKAASGAAVHREHTENLRRCTPATLERYGDVIDQIPFLDRQAFTTEMFADRYDVVIYSTLIDMNHGLYRLRGSEFTIAYDDISGDMTRRENWPELLERWPWLSEAFLTWFSEKFEFLGGLSEAGFRQNLDWLCQRVAPPKQLILLNAAEIEVDCQREPGRAAHHAAMNAVLDEVAAKYPHVDVCDVRQAIRSRNDLVDNIRHYRRGVYFQLAGQIEQLVARRHNLRTSRLGSWMNAAMAVTRRTLWIAKNQWFAGAKARGKS